MFPSNTLTLRTLFYRIKKKPIRGSDPTYPLVYALVVV